MCPQLVGKWILPCLGYATCFVRSLFLPLSKWKLNQAVEAIELSCFGLALIGCVYMFINALLLVLIKF